MKGDFRTVTSKAKVRKGTFTDVATGMIYPLNWAGHWGNSKRNGVLIPWKDVPRIDLEIDKIYRVTFDYKDKTGAFNDHHVDEYVVLVGISGAEDPGDRRKYCRFVTFESVSNFEVLKYKKESGC